MKTKLNLSNYDINDILTNLENYLSMDCLKNRFFKKQNSYQDEIKLEAEEKLED